MQIKILVDIDEGKDIVLRVSGPRFPPVSYDDVRDRMVKALLEEVGIRSGLLSMHYNPDGDAIIRPADYRVALSTMAERFYGPQRVKELLDEAVSELNKHSLEVADPS